MNIELINLLATTDVSGGEPTNTVGTPEGTTETGGVATEQTTTTPTETTPEVPSKYNIDGEEYDLDTIREWRKSGLRQSDYTKKTQEIAKQRKEAQEALEVYNYLMANQDLVKLMAEHDSGNPTATAVKDKLDPVQKQISELQTQLRVKDIDAELSAITSKDSDVTDVELLTIATQNNCDIKTAYNLWRGSNVDKIIAKREKELTERLKAEIQKNQEETRTLITPTDNKVETENYGLSDIELTMCDRLGMTPKEYATYKNPNYKL